MTIEEMKTIDAAKTYKELEEANAEIKRLKQVIKRKQKALLCVIPHCKHLHHEKGNSHKRSESCPVVNIVYDGIMQNACDL